MYWRSNNGSINICRELHAVDISSKKEVKIDIELITKENEYLNL